MFYDRDQEDKLIPVLATEVPSTSNGGISQDGLTYTFKIRQGVTFHDGSEMDADDVVFSINRLLIMGLGPSWMYAELLDDQPVFYQRFFFLQPILQHPPSTPLMLPPSRLTFPFSHH